MSPIADIHTFCPTGQSEGHEGADDAKHLHGKQRVYFPGVGVGSQQFQNLPSGNNNLLLLGPFTESRRDNESSIIIVERWSVIQLR